VPPEAPLDPAPPPVRRGIRTVQTLAIIYLLLVAGVALFQRRLIYFPTKVTPALAEKLAAENGFVPWRNQAGEIIGWRLPASAAPTGSVLIVHGNAGCAFDRDYLAAPIHDAASVDVYVLEYPGYGARAGAPNRASFFAAAEESFTLLTNGLPKYLVSESLGAGVAAHLARTHPKEVAGLVLFNPYHNLASVAQRKMPLIPAYFILLDRFAPAEDLKDYRGPVRILISGADEVIPPSSGRQLFDGYGGPKELQVIPGARHNDVAGQPSAWWREVFSFWRKHAD